MRVYLPDSFIGEAEYTIEFVYLGAWTVAIISVVTGYEGTRPTLVPLAFGASRYNPEDASKGLPYTKAYGRKMALRWAFNDPHQLAPFSRKERKEIYRQLFHEVHVNESGVAYTLLRPF